MARLGGALLLTCALVVALSSSHARAQEVAAAPKKPAYVSLPVQATADVKGRYVRRFEGALRGLEPPAAVQSTGDKFRWPKQEAKGVCAGATCLSEVARSLGTPRVAAWVLDADGYDFVLRVVYFRESTPDAVVTREFPIRHHALAKEGRELVEAQLQDLLSDPKPTPEKSAPGKPVAEKPPAEDEAPAPDEPLNPVEEPAEPIAGDEEGEGPEEEEGPRSGGVRAAAGSPVAVLTVEDVAARMDENVTGDAKGAAVLEPSAPQPVLVGDRSQLEAARKKAADKDWDAYWSKRKAAYAAAQEDPGERKERQTRLLLMGLVGLISASVGFFFGHQLNFRLRRRKVSFEAKVGAKEAAMTMATLRECARQLTPGVLMSPEFETSKRFCFSLVDGNQVSVDVMQLSEDERAAFRVGMQLCAQFVHKEGTAMCMMSVLRVQKMSPSRLRLVLSAPERLAQVTRPKGFKIPVDRSTPLLARALRASDKGTDQWQALVSVISDSTLEMALDDDAFKMAEGDRVDLKLRMDDIHAELVGQVVQLSSGRVHFELEDKHGGHPPREYQTLVRRLEGQWLSTLGS